LELREGEREYRLRASMNRGGGGGHKAVDL